MESDKKDVMILLPQVMIELQRELTHHPEISEKCKKEANTFEEALAMIATHCDLILDGYYDVPELCDVLIRKLQSKRIIVVHSF